MKNKIILSVLFISSLSFASSADTSDRSVIKQGRGTETGNGGDCVYVGGKCIPRDLLEKKNRKKFIPVLKNKAREFYESVPGFLELLRDLGSVHPGLALGIWNELTKANLYLVDWELDILPASETGMSSEYQADRQVCVRGERDIICSLPAYHASEFKLVYPIHEALHPMFGRDISPVRHEKVRALTDYLIENQGHYRYEELKEMMEGMNLYQYAVSLFDRIDKDTSEIFSSEIQKNILRILVSEKGTYKKRCQLISLVKDGLLDKQLLDRYSIGRNTSFWFDRLMLDIHDWSNYAACPKENAESLERYSDLVAGLKFEFKYASPYSAMLTLYVGAIEEHIDTTCDRIASSRFLEQLKEDQALILKSKAQFLDFKNDSLSEQYDLVESIYLKIAVKLIEKSKILEDWDKNLRTLIEEHPNRVKICEEAKRKVNRNWLEKFLRIGN